MFLSSFPTFNLSDFFMMIFDSVFDLLGDYILILKSIILFTYGDFQITAFSLRIGCLFIQIWFGVVFILAPRLGSGSVLKGNGI